MVKLVSLNNLNKDNMLMLMRVFDELYLMLVDKEDNLIGEPIKIVYGVNCVTADRDGVTPVIVDGDRNMIYKFSVTLNKDEGYKFNLKEDRRKN